MQYKNLILNIENDPNLYPLFLTLIELIPLIPELDNLIDEATQDGKITVNFVTKAESRTGGSFQQRGEIRGNQRTIERSIKVVSEGESFTEMFETLVFELCNAKNPNFQLFSFNSINTDDFADRDSYAFMTECAEYSDTHVPARKILKNIFSNTRTLALFTDNGIHISSHGLQHLTTDSFRSFDDWWDHVNRVQPGQSMPHAQIYREDFDRHHGGQFVPQPITHAQRATSLLPYRSQVPVNMQSYEEDDDNELSQAEILAMIKLK